MDNESVDHVAHNEDQANQNDATQNESENQENYEETLMENGSTETTAQDEINAEEENQQDEEVAIENISTELTEQNEQHTQNESQENNEEISTEVRPLEQPSAQLENQENSEEIPADDRPQAESNNRNVNQQNNETPPPLQIPIQIRKRSHAHYRGGSIVSRNGEFPAISTPISANSSMLDYGSTTSSGAFSQDSLSTNDDIGNNEPLAKRHAYQNPNQTDTTNQQQQHQQHQFSISPFTVFFSCIICREVPHTNIYQCRNGHLMCNACSIQYLAEHTMNNVTPRCPCCRVPISRNSLFRNLAVENALIIFPEKCPQCNQEFERNTLEQHKARDCLERLCVCKYKSVGCQWQGPFRQLEEHQLNCPQSKKTVAEIMQQLDTYLCQLETKHIPYKFGMELINVSHCFCLDLESRLYYSDRHIHMAYFGTRPFNAFGHQWAIKLRVNEQQQQQQQQVQEQVGMENSAITFKLQLKTRPLDTLRINFFILNGPFSNLKFNLHTYCYDFSFRRLESDYFALPLIDSQEIIRILANRKINFRVFMFLKRAQ